MRQCIFFTPNRKENRHCNKSTRIPPVDCVSRIERSPKITPVTSAHLEGTRSHWHVGKNIPSPLPRIPPACPVFGFSAWDDSGRIRDFPTRDIPLWSRILLYSARKRARINERSCNGHVEMDDFRPAALLSQFTIQRRSETRHSGEVRCTSARDVLPPGDRRRERDRRVSDQRIKRRPPDRQLGSGVPLSPPSPRLR